MARDINNGVRTNRLNDYTANFVHLDAMRALLAASSKSCCCTNAQLINWLQVTKSQKKKKSYGRSSKNKGQFPTTSSSVSMLDRVRTEHLEEWVLLVEVLMPEEKLMGASAAGKTTNT